MKQLIIFALYNSKYLLLLCSIICLISIESFGQSNQSDSASKEQTVTIKMNNGDKFVGKLLKNENDSVIIKNENGEFLLMKSNVKTIVYQDESYKYKFQNPHDTRYFFTTSGIPLKKGTGYYQNVLIVLNAVNFGLTRNFSIGGGFEFISTLLGYPIWYLTPKLSFNLDEKLHVGTGVLVAGIADQGSVGLGYGVVTFGDSETNLSLGTGFGYIDSEVSPYPVINISGMHRIGDFFSLLSENYILTNQNRYPVYFGIHGIRFLSKNSSFDIGLLLNRQIAESILTLPYIGYVRTF